LLFNIEERGIDVAKTGDYDRAVKIFDKAIKLNTKHTPALFYHRGEVHEKKGDYAKAISDYTEAIRRNPDFKDAYQRRGNLYAQKLRDNERANRDWEKVAGLESTGAMGTASTGLVCPSPLFGKLLWSGNQPKCVGEHTLLPGWRFRQKNTPWVCARCPQNCSFVEEKDKTYICVGSGTSRREITPESSASKSSGDALLGVQWEKSSNDMKHAPQTDKEIRKALENMGFKIIKTGTFGAFPGYWLQIADHAKAAQFSFKELKQIRYTERGQETSSLIGCWTEKKGDQVIIWIDWRDVEIRDESKLPPYVKLYAK
jgi:tetratricopeptide (TPR) repeat protein